MLSLNGVAPKAKDGRKAPSVSYAVNDKRFSFEGRGGLVKFDDGVRRAVLDWEMLMGEFSIGIYGENCRWTDPVQLKMTRDEVRQLVREFATAVPARILVMFADGHEAIEPST